MNHVARFCSTKQILNENNSKYGSVEDSFKSMYMRMCDIGGLDESVSRGCEESCRNNFRKEHGEEKREV